MIHYANPIDRSKVSLSISPFKFNAAAACIGSARAVGFESMEIGMTKREWTDIPADVHEALRKVKWFLELVGRRLNDEAYADEGNRAGLAIDCSFVADDIDYLLRDYGLPSRWYPHWFLEPETEAEAIERKLSKKN